MIILDLSDVLRGGFEKLVFYLKLMKKKIISIDKKNLRVFVEEKAEGKNIPIEIFVAPPGWAVIRTMLMRGDEVKKLVGSTYILYRELLRLSFRFPEFNFAMDDDYNIYIVHYIFLGALSYDVFEEEYNALPVAFEKFRRDLYPEIRRIIEEEQKIEIA